MRRSPTLVLCMWISSCTSTTCWRDCTSPVEWSWPVFVKLIGRSCMGLFLYLCYVWSVKCLFCSLLSASVLTEIALSTGAPLPRNPTPGVFTDGLSFGILLQCLASLFIVLSLRFLLALSLKDQPEVKVKGLLTSFPGRALRLSEWWLFNVLIFQSLSPGFQLIFYVF